MTNHGVQDKVIDFFAGHAVSEIDRVYWSRRVEDLRKTYAERQQHLNPLSLKQEYDLSKIEGLQAKIIELEARIEDITAKSTVRFESASIDSEAELEDLAKKGYECQVIAPGK